MKIAQDIQITLTKNELRALQHFVGVGLKAWEKHCEGKIMMANTYQDWQDIAENFRKDKKL